MANWAWPHTPASNCARLVLAGGPFDGEEVAFLPPDLAAPVQIVWSGWFPWGFSAYLYEWHGETTMDRGRTDALIYRPPITQAADLRVHRGRRVDPDEIPPQVAEDVEVWAGAPAVWASAMESLGVPKELLWPGL
jgi:hypothetical protein